ncbi:MAG TPA: hypothetical protein VEK05_03950 [Burkholderiales bacterium]|nr:hypothetical protein [Burkholderiales bacterium]
MRSTQLLHSEFTAAIEMLRLTRHSIWAAFFGLLTTTHVVPAAAEELPPPPYFVSKTDAVVIGIAYDESRIKKLSPSGLQVAPGATGQIIMYAAEDSYGLPAYSSSFMAVDLEGFDAPGGAKGRWMLAGLYSPGSVTAALAKYFNYPVREGVTRLEHQGQRVIAVGTMGGREMIRAELVMKPDPCEHGSGLIHEVTRKGVTGPVQLIKIPYVADWCPAESAKVDITAPASDPFGQLSSVKVVWAGVWRGGFGWSLPVNGH